MNNRSKNTALSGLVGLVMAAMPVQADHSHNPEFYDGIASTRELQREVKQHPTDWGYVELSDRLYDATLKKKDLTEDKKQKAVQLFDFYTSRALSLGENNPEALNNRGLYFATVGDSDKALELYSRAITINPFFKSAHQNLGNVYLKSGKWEEAYREFRIVQSLDQDSKYAQAVIAKLENAFPQYKGMVVELPAQGSD